MRSITNTKCALYETTYCDLLNMQDCEHCFVKGNKDYEAVVRDLDVLQSNLPEEPVHTLFSGPECKLCKGEKKGERAYYALVDMAHPEPKREKRNAIGMKSQVRVGSLLPLQVGTCKKCRNRMLILEYLPVLLPLVAGMAMLLLFMLPAVSEGLAAVAKMLPLAVFAFVILFALLLGRLIKRSLMKKYSAEMHLEITELPFFKALMERGWFVLSRNGNATRIVFSKSRMQNGVGTGTPEEANAKADKQPSVAETAEPYAPQHGALNPNREE